MLDALISAGASLLGNLFNMNSTKNTNEQNLAIANQNNATQMAIAKQNIDLQKEFAQHGIGWKVNDAVSAGLHPLIGAGAQAQSFSPVSVGTSAPSLEAPKMDFSSLGQDLSRAAKAMSSQAQREAVDQQKQRELELEGMALNNDVKRAELASYIRRNSASGGMVGPSLNPGSGRIPLPRPGPARTVSEGTAVQDDDIKQKAEDYPATKISRPFGYPLYSNPYFGDGQSFEDRYGESELGSTIKFGVNTIADHAYTGYKLWPWVDVPAPPSRFVRKGPRGSSGRYW